MISDAYAFRVGGFVSVVSVVSIQVPINFTDRISMSSFYVSKLKSGNWRVMEEIYKDGVPKQVTVPKFAYHSLGIDSASSVEEVRARVKQINKEKALEKEKMVAAARRVAKIGFYNDVFFQAELVDAFTERVRTSCTGSDKHLARLYSHFKFIQDMVLELKILPRDYQDEADRIYTYLKTRETSLDYSKKLIDMLNMWGKFVAKSQGSFFDPLKKPARKWRIAIAKAQRAKVKSVRRQSERLTLDMMVKMKFKLDPLHYNWIFCSLWLGLRPHELDQLAGTRLEIMNKRGSDVRLLAVNQTKIEGEEEGSGYKYIPLLYDEQKEAVELIQTNKVKRPSVNGLRDASNADIDTYCGRRGFVDLMQDCGQDRADASLWMGHRDLKTTMDHYKDPTNVPFKPVDKKKAG
jgi:integrase